MSKTRKPISVLAVVAAGALAAFALPPLTGAGAAPPTTNTHSQSGMHPGPASSLPAKAHAYGRYCQNQSKRHVAGQKGTPFSQCVTAMARLASNRTNSAREACKGLSKKHVAGERGTPYSRCVVAGNRLRQALHT
jgi:hypothetical protein